MHVNYTMQHNICNFRQYFAFCLIFRTDLADPGQPVEQTVRKFQKKNVELF